MVAQAQRSPAAVTKQTTGLTPDGLPVHSFRSLLADLATLARNTVTTAITPNYPITVLTRPTQFSARRSHFSASHVASHDASQSQLLSFVQGVPRFQSRKLGLVQHEAGQEKRGSQVGSDLN